MLAAAPAISAALPIDVSGIPVRQVGKVETVFKSPGPKPNGLQATEDGLWIMDQGDNHVYNSAWWDVRGFYLKGYGVVG